MYRLREVEAKDLLKLRNLEDKKKISNVMGMVCDFDDLKIDSEVYSNFISNRNNGIRCIIELVDTNLILGIVSLSSISVINRSAEIRLVLLNYKMNRKEVKIFAINTMLNHAFREMNLESIQLFIPESKKEDVEYIQRIGFKFEGIKKRVKCKNGDFEDIYCYDLLENEYKSDVSGTYNIPKYCLIEAQNRKEIEKVIGKCDNAFSLPVKTRKYYTTLVDKFSEYAHVIYAYNGEILGYIAFYANNPEYAYISLIAVRPEFQKLHIGKSLLKYCEDISEKKNVKNIRLEVRKDNNTAIKFYSANGYKWLEDKNETSFYMSKCLINKKLNVNKDKQ